MDTAGVRRDEVDIRMRWNLSPCVNSTPRRAHSTIELSIRTDRLEQRSDRGNDLELTPVDVMHRSRPIRSFARTARQLGPERSPPSPCRFEFGK